MLNKIIIALMGTISILSMSTSGQATPVQDTNPAVYPAMKNLLKVEAVSYKIDPVEAISPSTVDDENPKKGYIDVPSNDSAMSDHNRILAFLQTKNAANAEAIAAACLENMTFSVCRLSLAIAVQESKVGNHFKVANSGKWINKNADQVSQIAEAKDNSYFIRYNLWGVKYSSKRRAGGNFQPLIDLAGKTSYNGSVIGYKSYSDAFSDHNRILTTVYGAFTKDDISEDDISGISKRYLTGNKANWIRSVYSTFSQI